MRDSYSIGALISELQRLMRKNYEARVSVKLESDPAVAVRGTEIVVRARIFAPADVLVAL